jgi:ferredoxin-nitrate reductase
VNHGIKLMRRISEDIRSAIKPYAPTIEADTEISSKGTSRTLCDTLFPERRQGWNQAYEALVALQGFQMYLGHMRGLVVALAPTTQALWDTAFNKAVVYCQTQIERQQAWVRQQIAVRSPQTLLVPSMYEDNGDSENPAIG